MAKKVVSDLDRLFKSVEITIDSCWIWTGPFDKDGYARQMKVGSRTDNSRRMVRPHRLVYEATVGPIPEGFTIDHLCRRRCCLNPAHLEPVTTRENTQRGSRKNKAHCKNGHPLSGDNLYLYASGYRACKTCRNEFAKRHRRKTNGAAQRKYSEINREKRRLEQAARRAAWSPERLQKERERYRAYDAKRRARGSGG
ncbi:HNH endonuclease signature motif containing protein [Pseudorhodoplanes sp.]|uniref:HNH endonuclease signature motif containing protein n=1 Tax=Pseudorhodoplanes sp. TaxID=1934341 RepID=UPI002CBDDC45|nr:HNH endonuclease signature motif containing protein [Pseudorhodoplanes sp.]HWV44111.1 HNH endonuclease signature motif containing protein [Pseudorhodoplanes sp.]